MKDEKRELLHRREFFKKAAKGILPIVAAIVVPSIFTSCGGGDDDDITGCMDCSGTCASDCSSSCVGQSSSSTCSNCANNCTGGCDTSCSNTCKNNSSNNSDSGDEDGISKATGVIDGYEYVDLGLSVKWATKNIGASSPEKSGTYFLFSTEKPKGTTSVALELLFAGYEKGDSIAGSGLDNASAQMSSRWKTPTKAQIEELINNCEDEEFELNGITGLRLTSRKNGKSIFIPAVGLKDVNTLRHESSIYLWSSTISSLIASGGDGYVLTGTHKTLGGYSIYASNHYSIDNQKIPIRAITDGTSSSTGCNGGCSANCANNSSSSTCSGCSSTCSNGCKERCDYNCAATCDNHCYGTCNDSCGGSCRYVSAGTNCSGCAQTCYNRCYHDCSYACSTNCQSSCVNGSK